MIKFTKNKTAYIDIGDHENVVILVHGLGMNHEMWNAQIKELSKNYRVVAYDLIGHGQSLDPVGNIDLNLFSNQVLEIADNLKITQFGLIGFSLGGMIVRKFAIQYSNKLWALGILNSPYKRDEKATMLVQKRVNQVRKFGPEVTVNDAIERWFSKNFQQKNPDFIKLVQSWILSNNKVVYSKIYQLLVDGVQELQGLKIPIDCPSIVMTGDHDFGNSPEMSERIASQIKNSKLVILKGLKHMALAEDPTQVNKILLKFLSDALHSKFK
tara:strand:- start:291 stop:1097 length:807 start_codon:yes stop_codon:yes gene_type:complete